jgi:putative NADH-flavin reductase
MNTTIFGVGFAGGAIAVELAARGHDVTAVSRSGRSDLPEQVRSVRGSVDDEQQVAELVAGADVVVSALPGLGLAAHLGRLLPAVERAGVRLGVVGGSAVAPAYADGPRQADVPGFPAQLLALADAHEQVLTLLRAAPAHLDWFYMIPAAEFGAHVPGTRTGKYRTSTSALVSDAEGRSQIGGADYAIAFADEIERGTIHGGWIAVGY